MQITQRFQTIKCCAALCVAGAFHLLPTAVAQNPPPSDRNAVELLDSTDRTTPRIGAEAIYENDTALDRIRFSGATPGAQIALFIGAQPATIQGPFGLVLEVFPNVSVPVGVADPDGAFELPIPPTTMLPASGLYLQLVEITQVVPPVIRTSVAFHLVRRPAVELAIALVDDLVVLGFGGLVPFGPARPQGLIETGNSARSGDEFGRVLCAGDFDGDGLDDLAIGAPCDRVAGRAQAGQVWIWRGTSLGLVFSQVISQESVAGMSSDPYDRFGWSLTCGDYDADGFDDLAIGTPHEDQSGLTNSGRVAVVFGSSTGLRGSESFTQNSVSGIGRAAYDRFGWALTTGDFDADGFDDLGVGIPGRVATGQPNSGGVAVMFGSTSGLLPSRSQYRTQNSVDNTTNEKRDFFGRALTAADFNGDGYDDLAVGIAGEDNGAIVDSGRVAILPGGPSGTRAGTSFSQAPIAAETNETGDRFGYTLSSGDYDNDGFADLAIGAPFEDLSVADCGAIFVVYGRSSGLSTSVVEVFSERSAGAARGYLDFAGYALATGRLDTDPYDDLLIGIPGQNFSGIRNCGAVMSFHGTSSGLLRPTAGGGPVTADTNWLLQSSPLFRGTDETDDQFGFAVAIGNFNGRGPAEAAVAAPTESFGTVSRGGAVYVGQIPPGS